MWSSLLALALLMAVNPVRLGLTLLVISRPRPVQNLLVYWVGAMMVTVLGMLVPLMVLHVTPMLRSFSQNLATPATVAGSTVRHIQIGMGIFALSVAALVAVRSLTRRRQQAHLPTPGSNGPTLVLDSNTPPAISRLLGRAQGAPTEGGPAIQRLLGRAHNAWKNGSLWVAFVIGSLFGGPGADQILYVLAIIVASGAAIGTQVSAAITFVVVMLAVVEITLASYLVTPAKTQAIVQRFHDWAFAHRRKIVVAMCTMAGVSLVAHGMGNF